MALNNLHLLLFSSLWVRAGPSNLFLMNLTWQRWWDFTSEIKFQRNCDPPCCSHTLSPQLFSFAVPEWIKLPCFHVVSCAMEKPVWQRTDNRETNQQAVRNKPLLRIMWVSLEAVLLQTSLEVTTTLAKTLHQRIQPSGLDSWPKEPWDNKCCYILNRSSLG